MKAPALLLALPWMPICGCAVGPASISMGRSAYREVINHTEDEQLLDLIVRDRYSETYSLLAVASVTTTLRFVLLQLDCRGLSRPFAPIL